MNGLIGDTYRLKRTPALELAVIALTKGGRQVAARPLSIVLLQEPAAVRSRDDPALIKQL